MPDTTQDGPNAVVDAPEAELHQVNFRVPRPVYEGLRRLADRNAMSVPQLVAHEMTGFFLRERKALKESLAEERERARLQEEQLESELARVELLHEARAKELLGRRAPRSKRSMKRSSSP